MTDRKVFFLMMAALSLMWGYPASPAAQTTASEPAAAPIANAVPAAESPMDEVLEDEFTDDMFLNEEDMEPITIGLAFVEGTEENSELYGEVEFSEIEGGLSVFAELYNIPPGKHGFHIHENGSCEDKGEAAGGHYNPHGAQHGFLSKDGQDKAHAGDMGNIEIDANGEGFISLDLPGLSLKGEANNIIGKAVVIHEKEDDFGQPTGNAGARIGCGVIELIEY